MMTAPAPMLIVCSILRDGACPQARAFAAKASGLGGNVTVLPADLTHAQINKELGQPDRYTAAVDDFMHSLGLP
jgi:arylformamidase